MPRKTKTPTALPSIPKELLDQLVTGPMTPEAVQDVMMSFKKALIERALNAEMSHHLGYEAGAAKPAETGNHRNGKSRKTDRGTEMTCHVELSKRLNLDIWFADPHAPWQRGSNENTNGLLRQFLPKGIDLSAITQIQLNDIAKLLNGRPRQTLGWDTPEEAMAKDLEAAKLANRVALDY